MHRTASRRPIAPLFPTLLIALGLAGCHAPPPVTVAPEDLPCWGGHTLGTHGRREFFCERNRDRCVAQPANTWSNLAYLGAAFAVHRAARAGRGRRATGLADKVFAALLAAECVFLAVASGLFHASVTRWAERLDLSATYGAVLGLLGYALARLRDRTATKPRRALWIASGVLAAQALITAVKFHLNDFVLLPAVLVALALCLAALRAQGRAEGAPLRAGIAAAALAGVVWGLDLGRVVCAPESLVQGHAAWHVLTAVAIACVARALRGGRE